MRGIKAIWNGICRMDKKIIQKICSLIASCLILVAIVSAGFMSCTPNFDADLVSSRIDNGDRNNDRDDDDDDEDDGERCANRETCEEICEEIYDSGGDQVACQDEGINKVSRMDKVHTLLEKGTSRDFEKIFPDEDGVELDDLEDYLEVGVSGVEKLIRGTDGWNDSARINFLRWIIDERDVAEILNGLDDSGGHRLLEEVLDEVASSDCIEDESISCADNTNANNVDNYQLTSSTINICVSNNGGTSATRETIDLDTAGDAELYNALSCVHSSLRANGNSQNVFSYASIRNNNVIFDMAYDLLNSICEEVDDGDPDHKRACRKALLCWTGIKSLEGDDPNDNFFRDYVSNHLDDLERDRGGSNYNQCEPRHFDDFF